MNRRILLVSLTMLASSCAGSAPATVRIVASAGGVVISSTHEVSIPAGSLAADTEVTLRSRPFGDLPPLAGARPEVLALEPEGTTLETAATVVIDGSFIAAGASETVTIHQLETIDGTRWRLLASTPGAGGAYSVMVTRFSPLAVVVSAVPAGSGVRGTLRWGDGTPVGAAPLELFQGATRVATTTSDAAGAYTFTDVAPGEYRVVVMYECNIDRAVTVSTGAFATLDLTLCGA